MGRITDKKKDATRRKLLGVAARHFAEKGLCGANINDISLAAGLAKGTVYNYFPSKEALFLAVLESACAGAAAGADEVPLGATTRQRLHAALASDVRWARENEAFARVLTRETLSTDPQFYPKVLRAARPFLEKVEAILREGVRRGEIRRDVPVSELALWLVGLDELALVQHWGSGGAWPDFDEIPGVVLRLFLEGAAPRVSTAADEDTEEG